MGEATKRITDSGVTSVHGIKVIRAVHARKDDEKHSQKAADDKITTDRERDPLQPLLLLLSFSPTSTKPVGLKIEIKLNVIWSGSHGSEKLLSFGSVFRNARVLPLCTAMEIR